jgi:hypothetical protein
MKRNFSLIKFKIMKSKKFRRIHHQIHIAQFRADIAILLRVLRVSLVADIRMLLPQEMEQLWAVRGIVPSDVAVS